MKKRISKIISLLVLITLLFSNVSFLSAGIISYAASEGVSQSNVTFNAEIKDNNKLSVNVNVLKGGYLSEGSVIKIDNPNFTIVNKDYPNVIKIEEGNKVVLDKVEAGKTVNLELDIVPIHNDVYDLSLLNRTSKVNLTAQYNNHAKKIVNINLNKDVNLKVNNDVTPEDVIAKYSLLTNEVVKVDGAEKFVVQLGLDLGIKDNKYPVKSMETNLVLTKLGELYPEKVIVKGNYNNMNKADLTGQGENLKLVVSNNANESNQVNWKETGIDNFVISLIYDKAATINGKFEFTNTTKVTLQDDKVIEKPVSTESLEKVMGNALVQIGLISEEKEIYKGKLNAGIDRDVKTTTVVKSNLPNSVENLIVSEKPTHFIEHVEAGVISKASVVNFVQTIISKAEFDSLLGPNGKIVVSVLDKPITTIESNSPVDANGNFVITYPTDNPTQYVDFKISVPISKGDLHLQHLRRIVPQKEGIVKGSSTIEYNAALSHDGVETAKAIEFAFLKESVSEAKLDVKVNGNKLTTNHTNELELNAVLVSNNEMFNLYSNPVVTFELPAECENINIVGNPELLFNDDKVVIKESKVQGNKIVVTLEGKQVKYTDVEGIKLVVKAKADIKKDTLTKNSEIKLNVINGKDVVNKTQAIEIVTLTDMTVVHSIPELDVINNEAKAIKGVKLNVGEKTDKVVTTNIEITNTNTNVSLKNVIVAGVFATNNKENNLGIKILKEGIKVINKADSSVVTDAVIKYTENEDLKDKTESAWDTEIKNEENVKKFMINIPEMQANAKYVVSYKMVIPKGLQINKKAIQNVAATYNVALGNEAKTLSGYSIRLDTDQGKVADVVLSAQVGKDNLKDLSKVKSGEVIKVMLDVQNKSNKDIENVKVLSNIPNHTVLVEPKEDSVKDVNEWTRIPLDQYYNEVNTKTIQKNIPVLKANETVTIEYLVRVVNEIKADTEINLSANINYLDERAKEVNKDSNIIKLSADPSNIRITAKSGTYKDYEIFDYERYYLIVENTSNEVQKDVVVNSMLSDNLTVQKFFEAHESMEKAAVEQENKFVYEDKPYSKEYKISSIEPGKSIVLGYYVGINYNKSDVIEFYATATDKLGTTRSNVLTNKSTRPQVSAIMTSDTDNQYVKFGQEFNYNITVKNNGKMDLKDLVLSDDVPYDLTITKVSVDGKKVEEDFGKNAISLQFDLKAGQEAKIQIGVLVNRDDGLDKAKTISNSCDVKYLGIEVAKSDKVIHIISPNGSVDPNNPDGPVDPNNPDGPVDPNNPDGPVDPNDPNNPNNPDNNIVYGNKMISGMAWLDTNSNGIKEQGETPLNNVTVKLYNPKAKSFAKNKEGNIITASTNEEGVYILDSIGSGEFIIVFDYDKTKYGLTKYKVSGSVENNNSNAILNELVIDNNKVEVPSTDIIKVNDNNISDVNIGLIELKDYDLKLDKYVSKVLVQDANGTVVKEYENATLAKVELRAKKVNGTNIIVEYTIRVSNVGQVPAYARKVADDVPSALKFNSEMNKDWYQNGESLYNVSIANEVIKPGESKDLKLTLTKALTNSTPIGRINNTARIEETYSDFNLKENADNNKGLADIIISISTGGSVIWATTIISMIVILGVVVFIVIKKKNNIKKEL